MNKKIEKQPLYIQVKEYITARINSGEWIAGMKIDTEHELVDLFGISRMTANRALRELASEGFITRAQGAGTFVADRKPQSALLEIHSIADEIKAKGGDYSCLIHLLQEESALPALAEKMELGPYSPVFHSIIIHKDNLISLQLADRYVNPEFAPHFLEQDFEKITPNKYLLGLAPITEVEHVVEALIPDAWIRDLLQINAAEPCLVLHRRTWVDQVVVTSSSFYYPGSRHTIGSRFRPSGKESVNIS